MTSMLRRTSLAALPLVALALATSPLAEAEDAAKIFSKTCALCHGPEGQPNESFAKLGVRSFKDQAWQKATPDAQIEKSIREGKKGTMMASFEKQFSPDEIKALVAHVRKLGGAPAK
jgi:mono/diheme cytochrome c family protein